MKEGSARTYWVGHGLSEVGLTYNECSDRDMLDRTNDRRCGCSGRNPVC